MERFVATTKATQKQSSILTFSVKPSPVFVSFSLPPRSKRPLKFQASYTVETKLEIWEFASVTHNIPISKSLMHLECHNLLFCKKYEYVFYGVGLIRMTNKP